MIIVTHEMAFARVMLRISDLADGGVIVEHGDPHEVIDHPKEERTGSSSPDMRKADVEIYYTCQKKCEISVN